MTGADPVMALAHAQRTGGAASKLPSVDWRSPVPLPRPLPTVPEPDPLGEFLPASLAPWVDDCARRLGVPVSMIAAPLLVSLAGVIGRSHRIRPKRLDDWEVVPVLWGMVVGRPSTRKTPAIQAAQQLLGEVESQRLQTWKENSFRREARQLALKAEIEVLYEELRRAKRTGPRKSTDRSSEEIQESLVAIYREREQIHLAESRPRLRIVDATVEKLGELLIENERGLLLYRDELSGFISSLDRNDRPSDRAFYLEAFNGNGSFEVDRIGRGSLHIPALALSIIGGIQPSKIGRLIRGADQDGGDGLLARFQVVVWPELGRLDSADARPDEEARRSARAAIRSLETSASEAMKEGGRVLSFTPEAQDSMADELRHLAELADTRMVQACPAFEAYVAKLPRLTPALALLLELGENPGATTVGSTALLRARKWRELLLGHARKLYGPLLFSDQAGARALLEKIEKGLVEDGDAVRELHRAGWSGLSRAEIVEEALGLLEDHGLIAIQRLATGGRGSRVIRVHPTLRSGGSEPLASLN